MFHTVKFCMMESFIMVAATLGKRSALICGITKKKIESQHRFLSMVLQDLTILFYLPHVVMK